MVTEAGGLVGDFRGETEWLFGEQLLAGTPKVFAALVAMVAECPKVASLVPSQWSEALAREVEAPRTPPAASTGTRAATDADPD